jgi:hypothetical protein
VQTNRRIMVQLRNRDTGLYQRFENGATSNHSLSRVKPILASTVSADIDGLKHVERGAIWFLYV